MSTCRRLPPAALGLVVLALGACASGRRITPAPVPVAVATTTPAPLATTTVASGPARPSEGLEATNRLQRERRLAEALPHSTPHYRIDFSVAPDDRLQLVVTLLAVLNQPRDLPAFEQQLRRYKAEALAWVEAQGDDPATYTITWLPPEAAEL